MSDSPTADQGSTESAPDRRSRRSRWRPVSGPGRVLWSVSLTAVAGDLVTTLYGLEMGFHERNPVVATVLTDHGVAGLVGLKLVALTWIVAVWWVLGRRYGRAALVGLLLTQVVAVGLNVVTILVN